MVTESEKSVDELLNRQIQIDLLLEKLKEDRSDGIIVESRKFLDNTQAYIDNNKAVIPSYSLKKITDSLRKLESRVNEPRKTNLQFKFKTSSKTEKTLKQDGLKENGETTSKTEDQTIEPNKQTESSVKSDQQASEVFGFQNKKEEHLNMSPTEVESKDISLINLHKCLVKLQGYANTVYIRDLKECRITIVLTCRSVTVVNCKDCKFNIVCQQLRIDSTEDCLFEIYTSAGSMMESSKRLKFQPFTNSEVKAAVDISIEPLFRRANFDLVRNNCDRIDDFDCPNGAVKNYEFSDV